MYVCGYIRVCMYECMCVCMCMCVCKVCVYVHACVCACVCMSACMYGCMCVTPGHEYKLPPGGPRGIGLQLLALYGVQPGGVCCAYHPVPKGSLVAAGIPGASVPKGSSRGCQKPRDFGL